MAQFLNRCPENLGQVGQALHQQRQHQRASAAQKRQSKQQREAEHAKVAAQLKQGLASWISFSQ
jgi:hypothetical protein